MSDGSVLLNAYGCGFYRVTQIDSDAPRLERARLTWGAVGFLSSLGTTG
jgi:hypothetical protein